MHTMHTVISRQIGMLRKKVGMLYTPIADNLNWYITSRFQIAIDMKTIIIGHVLNNKYDQLLSVLR